MSAYVNRTVDAGGLTKANAGLKIRCFSDKFDVVASTSESLPPKDDRKPNFWFPSPVALCGLRLDCLPQINGPKIAASPFAFRADKYDELESNDRATILWPKSPPCCCCFAEDGLTNHAPPSSDEDPNSTDPPVSASTKRTFPSSNPSAST